MTRLFRPGSEAPPIRHVHLGLGAFFRAHQADYTERCGDAAQWGIAAFAGRSSGLADRLAAQGGLYTLVRRGVDGDQFDVVHSLSRAHRADDSQHWTEYFSDPDVSVVTLTITEAAYLVSGGGGFLDRPDVQSDIAALRRKVGSVVTVPGRIISGLRARMVADAGPITLIPCDNLPSNGSALRTVVRELAEAVDTELADWIGESTSTVSTLVDRITPATVLADIESVLAETGSVDDCPVVTEPYHAWVLSGRFAGPRPPWERSGAVFTDDIAPYEQRKLWLLNGAHSLLAYTAPVRGYVTVAQAWGDAALAGWVRLWWEEASAHLPFDASALADYRGELVRRFGNPRIGHHLAQIAADGSAKLPARMLPVLALERAQGRMPDGAVHAIAGWVLHLRGVGAPLRDAAATQLSASVRSEPLRAAVHRVLTTLDPVLGDDADLLAAVTDAAREISGDAAIT